MQLNLIELRATGMSPLRRIGDTPVAALPTAPRMDTNRDGVLTPEEYLSGLKGAPNLEQRFKNFDKNGVGKLSREEFVTRSGK